MATGLPTARWSPLQAVTTSTGALRTGRALAQAIPKSGVTNADYWAKHGEKLLAAFMGVAGLSRLLRPAAGEAPYPLVNMEHIATWVTMMSDATDPVINRILKAGLDKRQPLEVRLIARHASTTFVGVGQGGPQDPLVDLLHRIHAIDPWLEPSVAHSATDDPRRTYASDDTWDARPRFIDLEWLMAGEPRRVQHPLPDRHPTRVRTPLPGARRAAVRPQGHHPRLGHRRPPPRQTRARAHRRSRPTRARLAPRRGLHHRRARRVLRHLLAEPRPDPPPLRHPRRRRPVRAPHQVLLRRRRRPHHHAVPHRAARPRVRRTHGHLPRRPQRVRRRDAAVAASPAASSASSSPRPTRSAR